MRGVAVKVGGRREEGSVAGRVDGAQSFFGRGGALRELSDASFREIQRHLGFAAREGGG